MGFDVKPVKGRLYFQCNLLKNPAQFRVSRDSERAVIQVARALMERKAVAYMLKSQMEILRHICLH